MEFIKIKNEFLHNLKHVNVEIPKNKFVVVTGVSGSGKTSLISDIKNACSFVGKILFFFGKGRTCILGWDRGG